MPIGKVERPEGPQEQQKLGQILCSNGDIIPFFNTKGLEKDEPVIFDIIRAKIKVKAQIEGESCNYEAKTPVGILPLDFEPANSERKWSGKLQRRWKKEWSAFKEDVEVKNVLGSIRASVKNHPCCDKAD